MTIDHPASRRFLERARVGQAACRLYCAQEQAGFRRVQECCQARQHESADLFDTLQAGQSRAQVSQGAVVLVEISVEDLISRVPYFVPDKREERQAHHQQTGIDITQRLLWNTQRTDCTQENDGGKNENAGQQNP